MKILIIKYKNLLIIIWLIILLAIMILSLIPNFTPPNNKYHLDKILHFTTYMVITLPLTLYCHKTQKIFAVFLLLIPVAVMTEIFQGYIPGRTASIADLAANLSGVTVAFLISLIVKFVKN